MSLRVATGPPHTAAVKATRAKPPAWLREPSLRALLDEVIANPDDDARRLALADELARRGDPRGELIAGARALVRAPHWTELDVLYVYGNAIDEDATRELRARYGGAANLE
jgi:uncharacterized protein (TIGR02996 family)